jgi:hypothetical protein
MEKYNKEKKVFKYSEAFRETAFSLQKRDFALIINN